ncbi:hypothetical protein B566_EDAN001937 [Ephemera danica]|nr:hypothetical protein B566_EDAN001937 [Ephemera danica]
MRVTTMNEQVAVVTGANRGIGFAIVQGLCEIQFRGRVYLTSRDPGRGQAALTALNKLGLKPSYHQLDVTDEASVTRFRDFIETIHGGIDVLVNNAAINSREDSKLSFAARAELTMQTNFEGVVRVSEALWPLLREGARVVNISSTAGHLSRICGLEPHASAIRTQLASRALDREDLLRLMRQFTQAAQQNLHFKKGWPNSPYAVSKVGVTALTGVMQRELDAAERDVIVNCVHPGFVKTELSRQSGYLTPQQGARLPVQLCLLPRETTAPRGQFVWCDGSILDWAGGRTPRNPRPKPYELMRLEWSTSDQDEDECTSDCSSADSS